MPLSETTPDSDLLSCLRRYTDGLTAADWVVVTEYIDVLKPLKSATKRLEGRGKSRHFGAIAEIIPVLG
jgi:hypothetical protein